MSNPENPIVTKFYSKRILEEIDEYCVKTYDGGHRNHLGASLIGDDCKRRLWYILRWCQKEEFDGRKLRLFNRGHREEERFLEWLEGIGCNVLGVDIDGNQHRISDCLGHFGGSLDGKGFLPEKYDIKEQILFEFKTNKTGSEFDKLAKVGMIVAKPQHFAQMSTYGYKEGLNFCLYLNINKNDDTFYVELVKLDHNLGKQMIAKAEQIIFSQVAPERISENLTYFKCSYCHFKQICHFQKDPEKNCRSCINARPVEDAQWFCSHFNSVIPAEFIKTSCPEWVKIC